MRDSIVSLSLFFLLVGVSYGSFTPSNSTAYVVTIPYHGFKHQFIAIDVLSNTNTTIMEWKSPGNLAIGGSCVDKENMIYYFVAYPNDFNNNTYIYAIDILVGEFILEHVLLVRGMQSPMGISMDSEGNIRFPSTPNFLEMSVYSTYKWNPSTQILTKDVENAFPGIYLGNSVMNGTTMLVMNYDNDDSMITITERGIVTKVPNGIGNSGFAINSRTQKVYIQSENYDTFSHAIHEIENPLLPIRESPIVCVFDGPGKTSRNSRVYATTNIGAAISSELNLYSTIVSEYQLEVQNAILTFNLDTCEVSYYYDNTPRIFFEGIAFA